MDPHESWGRGGGGRGGHRYVSFRMCFPSRRNGTVLSQHLAPVYMRPVGPRKCTRFIWSMCCVDLQVSPPGILIQQGSQSESSLHVQGYTNTECTCTRVEISPRSDSLNSCNAAAFQSPGACLVELCCGTKLRHHALAAGCMHLLHLVLW